MEEGGDYQSGDYRTQEGVVVQEVEQEVMERRVDSLEDARKHHRKSAVDEGTVYDDVYLVEAVLENGYAHSYRDACEANRQKGNLEWLAPPRLRNA